MSVLNCWPLLVASLLALIATRMVSAATYSIDLKTTSGSVVLGGTMEFQATLLTDGKPENGDYEVIWSDNMNPPNTFSGLSQHPYFNWTKSYENNVKAGSYVVTVVVKRYIIFYYMEAATKSMGFNLTSLLNGQMQLVQNSSIVDTEYVSSAVTLNQ